MVDLRIRITGVGEDALVHWLIMDLIDPVTSEVFDRDRFRWAKGTKRVLTNPPPDRLNPPPGFVPILGPPIEANKFDYDEVLTTAARHFLRRQGLLPRTLGQAWTPVTINRLSGLAVARTDPNSDKLSRMRGAEADVGDPGLTGTLRRRQFGSGTVTTISTDFDGDFDNLVPTCDDTGTAGRVGTTIASSTRIYIRFPLSSIGANDFIDNVQLIVNVTAVSNTPLVDVQGYNIDGQADPSPDACATRGTRCQDDATPYLDNVTDFQSTGVKTLDLGIDADNDVEAAKDAVDRYSVGLNENTSGGPSFNADVEMSENSGTDEPKLELTHSAAVFAPGVKVAVVSAALSTTAGGTTNFTKAGFGTPKACIVLLSFDAPDDISVSAEGKASIGFSDFTNQFCITHQDEDGSAKVDCDARKSNTRAYVILGVTGALDFSGTASPRTDGVKLTHAVGEAPASALFATVIMFGGADLAIDLRRTLIASAQDATATIPHSGFTDGNDKLIFFIGTDIAGEDNSSTGINNAFGVCHARGSDAGGWTLVQRCLGWASDHNNNVGSPHAVLSTDRVLDIITEAGVQDWGLEVTDLDHAPAEWTVTTRDNGAGAGMEVYSLALDMDDRNAKVGSVDSPISGATWTPAVALGFTPQYVGLGLTHLPTEDTIDSGADAGAQGISSNTGPGEETFHGWYNEDASAAANTNNNFRSRVLDLRDDDVATVIHDHSHLSFNVGDWTYTINTENETTARKWFYWAIEEAALDDMPWQQPPQGIHRQVVVRAY